MAAIAHTDLRRFDRRLAPTRRLSVCPPPAPSRAVFLRRRAVVAFVVALLVAGAVLFLTADPQATTVRTEAAHGATAEVPRHAVYVVQPGDTLWSIAETIRPHDDVRGTVDRLVELNGSAALQAGQHLVLP